MAEKKLIDKHWEWMESGLPDGEGLCNALVKPFGNKFYKTLDLFEPDDIETAELYRNGFYGMYWGRTAELYYCRNEIYNSFRQTIVLFICAMHWEI